MTNADIIWSTNIVTNITNNITTNFTNNVTTNITKDMKAFKEEYSPIAEPTLDGYEGKFIMKHAIPPPIAEKMGMKETKSFGTTGDLAFMLQFPDWDKAMGWFTGPEYAAVISKRDEVSDFRMAVCQAFP